MKQRDISVCATFNRVEPPKPRPDCQSEMSCRSVLTFDIYPRFRSFSPEQVGYIRPTSHRQTLRYPFQSHRRLTLQSLRHPHLPFIPFGRVEQIHSIPSYVLERNFELLLFYECQLRSLCLSAGCHSPSPIGWERAGVRVVSAHY